MKLENREKNEIQRAEARGSKPRSATMSVIVTCIMSKLIFLSFILIVEVCHIAIGTILSLSLLVPC